MAGAAGGVTLEAVMMIDEPIASEVVLIVGCECARSGMHRDDPPSSRPCPKCDGRKYTEARFASLTEMQAFAATLRMA
jgi:hypothetical protein